MANNNEKTAVERLVNNNCGMEPSTVGYTMLGRDVEDFLKSYLESRGIDGVVNTTLIIGREGNENMSISLYAFLSPKSADLISSINNNLSPIVREKMGAASFGVSKNFEKTLRTLVDLDQDGNPKTVIKLHEKGRESVVSIRIDIFKVLMLMLDAPSKYYKIVIYEAYLDRRKSVLTVFKQEKQEDYSNNSNNDYFRNIARNLSTRNPR